MPQYTHAFDAAVARVLELEGGYVNDPADPGGETNMGISRRAYPYLDIRRLTREDAIAIYHRDYWTAAHLHNLPDALALIGLHLVTNMGIRTGVEVIQTGLNIALQWQGFAEGRRTPWTAGLYIDGIIGPRTAALASELPEPAALFGVRAAAANRYLLIAGRDRKLRRFLLGWLAGI